MAEIKYQTTAPYRNNWIGPGSVATIDEITHDFMHFDFGIKWLGANGAVEFDTYTPAVALSHISLTSEVFDPTQNFLYVEWQAGTLAGTVKERFYILNVLVAERDNVDPGFGSMYVGGVTSDQGRYGPKYTFALNAGRFEAYVNFRPNVGQRPVASAPAPAAGYGLPFRLEIRAPANVGIQNIQLGRDSQSVGTVKARASYRKEEQIKHFGSLQTNFYLRLYQKARYYPTTKHGIPLDLVVPPL